MKKSSLAAPFLKRVTLLPEKVEHGRFPFGHLPFLKGTTSPSILDQPSLSWWARTAAASPP